MITGNLSGYLNTLVAHNRNNRPPFQPGSSLSSYARENCTVSLRTFREAGHTSAILNLVSNFNHALVLGPSRAWLDRIKPKLPAGAVAGLASRYSLGKVRATDLDLLVIDNASLASPYAIARWYNPIVLECFFRSSPLYVLVG